jgi:hypothetical protein
MVEYIGSSTTMPSEGPSATGIGCLVGLVDFVMLSVR